MSIRFLFPAYIFFTSPPSFRLIISVGMMPGIGHLVYGLAMVAGLLYISKNKMNHKVLFIFFVNNYLGPDAAHVYWGPGHTLLGFIAFAIPLSLFYSYLSRFSIQKTRHFIDVVDDGKREVNWKNAFYATVAGGITHRMIDFLFHPGHHMGLTPFPGIDLSLEEMNNWTSTTGLSPWIVLDMALIVFSIVGTWYAIRDGFKSAIIFLGIIVMAFGIAAIASLLEVESGENDLSVFLYAGLFNLAPLLLIGHADRETQAHPFTTLAHPRFSRKIIVPLFLVLFTAVICIFFAAGIAATFFTGWFENLIDYSFGGPTGTQIVGGIFIVLTGIGLAGCIGAFFHAPWGRSIIMVISTLTWYLVIPFGVALLLSEKEVKGWFEQEGRLKGTKKNEES